MGIDVRKLGTSAFTQPLKSSKISDSIASRLGRSGTSTSNDPASTGSTGQRAGDGPAQVQSGLGSSTQGGVTASDTGTTAPSFGTPINSIFGGTGGTGATAGGTGATGATPTLAQMLQAIDEAAGPMTVANLVGPGFGLTGGAAGANLGQSGTGGNDRLQLGASGGTAHGRTGADVLRGSTGSDTLLGGRNRDRLLGGTGGFDVLSGGRGADMLDAGTGVGVVHGGPGADSFQIGSEILANQQPDTIVIADFDAAEGDKVALGGLLEAAIDAAFSGKPGLSFLAEPVPGADLSMIDQQIGRSTTPPGDPTLRKLERMLRDADADGRTADATTIELVTGDKIVFLGLDVTDVRSIFANKGGTGATGGASGASGGTGPGGTTGAGGATGATGGSGASGATGGTGSGGTNGATGATGATGGASGATGSTGGSGASGATGGTGPGGTTGAGGETGATGSKGSSGAGGATGATGPKGGGGATGSKGSSGASGASGATGSKGGTGPGGTTGATGGGVPDGDGLTEDQRIAAFLLADASRDRTEDNRGATNPEVVQPFS